MTLKMHFLKELNKTASTLLITVVRYFKRLLRKNKTLGYMNIQTISIRKEFYTQQQL